VSDELTIGELSARSGIAPSALRFYETQGLIAARRTSGNQRRYERAILRRIALLQAGRAAGMPDRPGGALLRTRQPSSVNELTHLTSPRALDSQACALALDQSYALHRIAPGRALLV
jgi:DNA-binding transcriptional MerR regulator